MALPALSGPGPSDPRSRAVSTVRNGRSLLPPPRAACRMAAMSRDGRAISPDRLASDSNAWSVVSTSWATVASRIEKELVDGIMISLNSGNATEGSEESDVVDLQPRSETPPARRGKPMTVSRALRRIVQIGLSLVLLWVAVVFWLGLSYSAVPPVSTLMLGRWITLQPVERHYVGLDQISP